MAKSNPYRAYAKSILKDAIDDSGLSYKELARVLRPYEGKLWEPQALTNKVNRGTFSLEWTLKVLTAIKALPVTLSKPPGA